MLPTSGIQNRPAAAPAAPAPAPTATTSANTAFAQLLLGQAPQEPPPPPAPAAKPAPSAPPADDPQARNEAIRGKRAQSGGARTRATAEPARPGSQAKSTAEAGGAPHDAAAGTAGTHPAEAAKSATAETTDTAEGSTKPQAKGDADAALGELAQWIGLGNAVTPAPVTTTPAAGDDATAATTTASEPPTGGRHRLGNAPALASEAGSTDAAPGADPAVPPSTAHGRDTGHAAGRATSTAPQGPTRAEPATAVAATERIAEASGPTFAQTLAISGRSAEVQNASAPVQGFETQMAATLATPTPAPGSTGFAAPTAPTTLTSRIQAHYQSSAFAPEVAARVSVLAADGVQRAELQLNPADMGPVNIDIVVQGQQAHVSFEAAQADTRQALERSLPDLAAALRDSGLTLAGGGVFQQSPNGGGADSGQTPARRGASGPRERQPDAIDLATAALSRPPGATPQGLLDTFA
jgi:flagellar hook-length control protein FliK